MLILPQQVLTDMNGAIGLTAIRPSEDTPTSGAEDHMTSATGPWGEILFRQVVAEDIPIQFHTLRLAGRDTVRYKSPEPSLRLQVALERSFEFRIDGFAPVVLHERGISLCYAPSVDFTVHTEPGAIQRHLIMHFFPGHLEPLQESLPALNPLLAAVHEGKPSLYRSGYPIADGELIALTEKLGHCPYTGKARTLWLNSLAQEILVLALVRMNEASPLAVAATATEARLVYSAREWLLAEIEKPFALASLAQRTGSSAYKLNNSFRAVYGKGVMEWLLEARMARAHKLLEGTEDSVSQIAWRSGYSHPHSFTLAFKKYFGYTPAFVQKNGKRV